mgnify:CR=1 FL=1
MEKTVHIPVLLNETLDFLAPKSNGTYMDMTVGAGGHSVPLLKMLGKDGFLIGIDRDKEILNLARQSLIKISDSFILKHASFSKVHEILKELNITGVDGVLFDIGVSSFQLSKASRGFIFRSEAFLDMRMDKESDLTAADIINNYTEEELRNIFFKYGEEKYSRRIASNIVKHRKIMPIKSTRVLANLVANSYKHHRQRIHPATKVFQALRIVVNDELNELQQGLKNIIPYLKIGGKVVVISFHSLEDRIVKNFFRTQKDRLKILTKKPLTAGSLEKDQNVRSRSAKLRCAQKI